MLAILAVGTEGAAAARRPSLKCADSSEVSALQTAAIQQQLMVAALGCGGLDLQKFNAFQTNFGPELRRSDNTLLQMFRRVYGARKGEASYHLFKTDLADKAELRRVRGLTDYCMAADIVFASALAPVKPTLRDFVAGVQVADQDRPVQSCDVTVAVSFTGVAAAPGVAPKPKPDFGVSAETDGSAPAGSSTALTYPR